MFLLPKLREKQDTKEDLEDILNLVEESDEIILRDDLLPQRPQIKVA